MTATEYAPAPRVRSGRGVVGWVRRHPVGTFLIWTYAVGQPLALTPVVAEKVYGIALPTEPFLIAATAVALLLPVLVITWIVDGSQGLRTLRRRMLKVRLPIRWYLLPLVVVPMLVVLPLVLSEGAPAGLSAVGLGSAVGIGFLLQTAVVLVTVNWWEEMAWTGFVQARLQDRFRSRRYPAMLAAVAVAPLFAVQHAFMMFESTVVDGLIQFGILVVFAVIFRSLQGWMYNRTDSLFLVGLVHAAGNAAALGSLAGVGLASRLYGQPAGVTVAFGVLGLIVIIATRLRLGYPAARVP